MSQHTFFGSHYAVCLYSNTHDHNDLYQNQLFTFADNHTRNALNKATDLGPVLAGFLLVDKALFQGALWIWPINIPTLSDQTERSIR